MSTAMTNAGPPALRSVPEAVRILRVDPATLYPTRPFGRTPSPPSRTAPAQRRAGRRAPEAGE